MADEPELSRRPLAIKLTWWNRAILDVLGLAGLGAGAAAVFITHLEAGPVALIAAGLLLLLIGIGGHMPSLLKVGDNEAQWEIEREAMQVFVERVAEEVPVANQREFLGALGDLAERAPQAAAPGIVAMAYEQQLRDEISQAIAELQVPLAISAGMPRPIRFVVAPSADRPGFEAILEGPTGNLVAVEARYSAPSLSPAAIEVMHSKLSDQARHPNGPQVMLLITRVPFGSIAQQRLKQYPEIHHVVFRGPEDREALKQALRDVYRSNTRLSG